MEDEYEKHQTVIESFLTRVSGEKKNNKYKVLQELEQFLFQPGQPQSSQPYLATDQLEFILLGETEKGLTGILALCTIKVSFFDFKKSKRSCEIALRIAHTMLFDPSFKLSSAVQDDF